MDWLSPEKWCLKDYFPFEMAPFYGTCWFSAKYTPDPMCKAAFLPLQTLNFLMCPEACEFGESFFEQDRNVSSNFTFCILGEHLNMLLNSSSDLDSARHLKVSGSRTKANKQTRKREEVWFEVSGKWVLLVVLISFLFLSNFAFVLWVSFFLNLAGEITCIHHVSVGKGLISLSWVSISTFQGFQGASTQNSRLPDWTPHHGH